MKAAMSGLWAKVQGDPVFMRKINGWLAVVWFAAALPICIWFSTSVPFLVFISVYAVVTGHWSTWQAAKVEVRQQEAESSDSSQNT
jgi:preprotein translocase subunit SecG